MWRLRYTGSIVSLRLAFAESLGERARRMNYTRTGNRRFGVETYSACPWLLWRIGMPARWAKSGLADGGRHWRRNLGLRSAGRRDVDDRSGAVGIERHTASAASAS